MKNSILVFALFHFLFVCFSSHAQRTSEIPNPISIGDSLTERTLSIMDSAYGKYYDSNESSYIEFFEQKQMPVELLLAFGEFDYSYEYPYSQIILLFKERKIKDILPSIELLKSQLPDASKKNISRKLGTSLFSKKDFAILSALKKKKYFCVYVYGGCNVYFYNDNIYLVYYKKREINDVYICDKDGKLLKKTKE